MANYFNDLFNYSSKKPTEGVIPDFNYTGDIPAYLKPTFDKLTLAVNNKKNLLTEYSKLPALLKDLDNLINNYITKQSNLDKNLESERQTVKTLKTQQQATADQTLRNQLQSKIDEHEQTIETLKQQQQTTTNTDLTAINAFSESLIDYIKSMPPNTPIDQNLLNRLKAKLGQVNKNQTLEDVDDEKFEFQGQNPTINRIVDGGYRYSSSQMRRKSTARRSSASGSSSSKRRRNKKRTAKKMMLGGKRMKKTKSTKRKHNKKH